jgi:hypothetical protein
VRSRLDRLAADLDRFPAGVACPWPLARVFNELVKLVKRDLSDDPVMRTVRLLEEGSGEFEPGASNAAVGTVRALIGQVQVACEAQPSSRVSGPQRAPKRARGPA